MLEFSKYSMGVGDRFGRQGKAQLEALRKACAAGAQVIPVWNKSHREHTTIGSRPEEVRREADAAVAALGWEAPYFVDADHIHLDNVDDFIAASDFFTLDVADYIGRPAEEDKKSAFLRRAAQYTGRLAVPGIERAIDVDRARLEEIADRYLFAVQQAGAIYRHIERAKGADRFVTEVSMDETAAPQTPDELFFILLALAEEKVPARTVAPKFSGRFNKGVDYVGDVALFAREFAEDVAVARFAAGEFGLPEDLKLSVHSGSDKFSLYPPMRKALQAWDAGVHIKTAGTTWLEEVIGLALAGDEGWSVVLEIYRRALDRREELCAPYATVIDIRPDRLPAAEEVEQWSGEEFAARIRHDRTSPSFHPDMRQLLHVAYKVAAELGPRYLEALDAHETLVAEQVTGNLFERHMRPLFLDATS